MLSNVERDVKHRIIIIRHYSHNSQRHIFIWYNSYISNHVSIVNFNIIVVCVYYVAFKSILITKTCLYNFDPLKPHFNIVKLGFTGVYIIFLISAQNIDCGYSLEPPRRGSSNEYPQSMLCAEI